MAKNLHPSKAKYTFGFRNCGKVDASNKTREHLISKDGWVFEVSPNNPGVI